MHEIPYAKKTSDGTIRGKYDPKQRTAYISAIGVKLGERKAGHGRAMFNRFLAWAQRQGAHSITGKAVPKSLGFWKKMGFDIDKEDEDGFHRVEKRLK